MVTSRSYDAFTTSGSLLSRTLTARAPAESWRCPRRVKPPPTAARDAACCQHSLVGSRQNRVGGVLNAPSLNAYCMRSRRAKANCNTTLSSSQRLQSTSLSREPAYGTHTHLDRRMHALGHKCAYKERKKKKERKTLLIKPIESTRLSTRLMFPCAARACGTPTLSSLAPTDSSRPSEERTCQMTTTCHRRARSRNP